MIKKVHNSACVVSFVGFKMIIGALAPGGKIFPLPRRSSTSPFPREIKL